MVVDTACDWVKPIYLTDHDIDVMDRQTKKDILAHNKAWQANWSAHELHAMHLLWFGFAHPRELPAHMERQCSPRESAL